MSPSMRSNGDPEGTKLPIAGTTCTTQSAAAAISTKRCRSIETSTPDFGAAIVSVPSSFVVVEKIRELLVQQPSCVGANELDQR